MQHVADNSRKWEGGKDESHLSQHDWQPIVRSEVQGVRGLTVNGLMGSVLPEVKVDSLPTEWSKCNEVNSYKCHNVLQS